jgi:hypothetical protein
MGRLKRSRWVGIRCFGLKEARIKRDELAAALFRGESPARQKQLEKVALANSTSARDFCEPYFNEVIEKTWKDPIQVRRTVEASPGLLHLTL